MAKTMPLPDGWKVIRAEVHNGEKAADISVSFTDGNGPCPQCGSDSCVHGHRRRKWRHLDLLEHQAWVICDVPRVSCTEHGAVQMVVRCADANSRFTERFECRVIDWLKEASMSAVARNVRPTWD
jgi:transposase